MSYSSHTLDTRKHIFNFWLGVISISFVLFLDKAVFAQSESNGPREVIALSAGTGMLTFHGDVGDGSIVGAYSFIRSGLSVSIEKNIHRNFILSANFLNGKIARDENSSDNLPKLNFESTIMQLGLSGTYLVKGKSDHAIIPFLSAGMSFLQFDPYADLLDANNRAYHYWKDGSIRDLPETGLNYFYAQQIDRDYEYETKLSDSSNFSKNGFCLPISAGIKLRLTSTIDANLGLAYNLAFTDHLDNVETGGMDTYLFTSASLTYHLFSLSKKEKEKASQLFSEMDKADSDQDGVLDINDLCPETNKLAKVDTKGCPLDEDGDGVPDYLDKQTNTKNGVLVDAEGKELTRSRLRELSKEQDVAASSRKDALSKDFNEKPSAEFMRQVEEMQKEKREQGKNSMTLGNIPHDLRVADWNKDGIITSNEIAKTIDAFFDGTITFSVEQINRLIDFFFEQ